MQTKKRAKSISFGKKEKEAAPKPAEKEVKALEVEEKKAEEKEEKVEATTKVEEPKIEERAVEETKEAEPEAEDAETDVAEEKAEAASEPDTKEEDKDSLEKDLESLKEPESTPDANPSTVSEQESSSEPKTESAEGSEEPKTETTSLFDSKEEKTEPKKEDAGPFTVQSAFSKTDGLYDKKKKSAVPFFFLVAAVAFVLGLVVMAGADYWMKQANIKLPNVASLTVAKPSPTPKPASSTNSDSSEKVEPTEKPKEVDVSEITVAVLNGSGVVGEAAKVKKTLTTAGFTVSSTGNADASTYKKTEIIAKKTVDKAVLTKLADELGETYVVASPTAPTGTQATDIVVIIGSTTK